MDQFTLILSKFKNRIPFQKKKIETMSIYSVLYVEPSIGYEKEIYLLLMEALFGTNLNNKV